VSCFAFVNPPLRFDVDDIHRAISVSTNEHIHAIDHFIQDKRMIGVLPHRKAFFVRQTWLLDVDVDIADCANDSKRIVHSPTRVRIGDKPIAPHEHRGRLANAFDVHIRSPPFQLKA
jgi:hypothetical protein